MASVGDRDTEGLRLGEVTHVHVRVGYRRRPEDPPHEQYLLDLPMPAVAASRGDGFDERPFLDALRPVVFVDSDVALPYALHVHRSHTSGDESTNTCEIGVTVTLGPATPGRTGATYDAVAAAFPALLELAGRPHRPVGSRDEAVTLAWRGVETAYGVDPDRGSLAAEQHLVDRGAWSLDLRAGGADAYGVLVGMVDGYAGAVQVRYTPLREVLDSVGNE